MEHFSMGLSYADYKRKKYVFNKKADRSLKKRALCLLFSLFIVTLLSSEERNEPDGLDARVAPSGTQLPAKTAHTEKTRLQPALDSKIILTVDYPWNASLAFTQYFDFYRTSKNGKKRVKKITLFTGAELTPATLSVSCGAVFMPQHFIGFFTKAEFGTGWSFPKASFYGIAGNTDFYGRQKTVPYNFSKLFILLNGGISLQFKLQEFAESDWSDLTLGTRQAAEYKALFPGTATELWFFKNDEGENRNGAVYAASYFIEYKMPLYLSAVRAEFNTRKKLYAPLPGSKNRSELLWDFELGGCLVFKPYDFMDIQIAALWSTAPLYTYSPKSAFFTEKILNYPKTQTFYFKKISAQVLFKI